MPNSLLILCYRVTIKSLYISRSALSCCVLTGIPHEIIKHYCLPRDMSFGSPEIMNLPNEWYIVDDHDIENDEIGDE